MGTGFICDTAVVIGKEIKTAVHGYSKKRDLNNEKHYDAISYKCHVAEFLSNN